MLMLPFENVADLEIILLSNQDLIFRWIDWKVLKRSDRNFSFTN